MLVLTRKTDEQIVIGQDIKITLLRVRGNSVRLGIEAPGEVRVRRGEVVERAAKAKLGCTGDVTTMAHEEEPPVQEVFAHPEPPRGARRSVISSNEVQAVTAPASCDEGRSRPSETMRQPGLTRNGGTNRLPGLGDRVRRRRLFSGSVISTGTTERVELREDPGFHTAG